MKRNRHLWHSNREETNEKNKNIFITMPLLFKEETSADYEQTNQRRNGASSMCCPGVISSVSSEARVEFA